MNHAAALIAVGIGGVFFAVATAFPYRPGFIKTDASDFLSTNHGKARAAVTRLLLYPNTAEFTGLRTVDVEQAKYVCGGVKAKDRQGAVTGARAFVYTVAIDFARIDDDGQIAQRHDPYRACPESEEEALARQQKLGVSPGALAVAKVVQKGVPASDTTALTNMSSQLSSSASAGSSAGGRVAGAGTGAAGSAIRGSVGGSAGQQSQVMFKATLDNESEWRADRPPEAWPLFPAGHALARPGVRRTGADAVAAANALEQRWAQSMAGTGVKRPATGEIHEAMRTLMAVDAKSLDYPAAWAAFVRLRKIEREAIAT
ncbi:MAG: hypothetical protein ABWY18_12865 [Tardiphaga sp.]